MIQGEKKRIYGYSPCNLQARARSLGRIVIRLAWIAARFVFSNETKHITRKVETRRRPRSRNVEKRKNVKSHRSGLPEEVIRLEGRSRAIIVVLCGLIDVVSEHPKMSETEVPIQRPRNVFDVLFFQMELD